MHIDIISSDPYTAVMSADDCESLSLNSPHLVWQRPIDEFLYRTS